MQDKQEETAPDLDGEMGEAELDEVSGGTGKLSKTSLEKQQRLQSFTNFANQGTSMVSNLMKKTSTTGENITVNMK